MRFILCEVSDSRVRMKTRTTNSNFWTNKDDLIFIMTPHNIQKANKIIAERKQKSQLQNLTNADVTSQS